MPTYQTTHPLARTSPLRSIPTFRAVQAAHTPEYLTAWELDRALAVMPNLEKQFAYARQVLGDANRQPRIARRRFQSQAMSFLNRARAALRAGRARVAAAEAAVAALALQPVFAFAVAA